MGLFEFLNRHRNKILLAGGAAGAVMVINKILANYEKQWESSSSRTFVHEARKKEIHFENIINECNQQCQRCSTEMINKLQDLLDDQSLIDDLASKRQDKNIQSKVEIWKSLKVKILTKLLGEIYCTCFIACYMRVQMSIIGGHIFAKSASANTAGSSSASVADLTHMKIYSKYTALIGSFFDKIDCLVQPIEDAVEETLRGYSMDYKISVHDFEVILDKIKRSMSFYLSGPDSKTKVFFLEADKLSTVDLASTCPDSGNLNEQDEKVLRDLLAETQDILESEDFKNVLESSIEVGYKILLDNLLGAFIKMESKLNASGETSNFSNPNAIKVPLVKILPQIRSNYRNREPADQKALINHLLCLDVLNCFAANVYEAFCEPK